jgi:glycosyltransferase involved in cell wall biosynthesis
MKLSVIIPCYNGAEFIRTQLEALAGQAWDGEWEVIVADNGSTDASLRIVEEFRGRLPNLRIVDASDRKGRGHARNVGVRASTGDAILFCDADDKVGAGWLAAMAAALAEHDFVACGTETEELNPPWLQWPAWQADGPQPYRYPPYLPHAGGGTLGVIRTVFDRVGGFDETLLRVQDCDFCWRVQLSGVPLEFARGAVLHIRQRDTLWGIFQQARGLGEYNVVLYKRYRRFGMPALSLRTGLAAWKGIMLRLPRIRGRAELARWIWQFAWRLGRLQASVKYQVLAL